MVIHKKLNTTLRGMSKTISLPDDLYEKLEKQKSPRQPFSGVIQGLMDEVDK